MKNVWLLWIHNATLDIAEISLRLKPINKNYSQILFLAFFVKIIYKRIFCEKYN